MAACVPSGLGAGRITPLVLADQQVAPFDWQLDPSANQPPHRGGSREGPAVFVGDRPVDVALEEGEHGEPDARPSALLVRPGVGQGVVVQEEPGGDVEGDEHVDGVVLVSGQDEEDAEEVQDPGQGVDEVPAAWSVWGKKREKDFKKSINQ